MIKADRQRWTHGIDKLKEKNLDVDDRNICGLKYYKDKIDN
jgi:hypothetical protein